jgi:BirA family biotin operon repressor/biotin-[acetyl-CoA-carboxylase] ligase
MQIIKLSATPSTNSYLKQLAAENDLEDFTVVVCSHQTQGRGQKGNSWATEEGKNLTVSILKKFNAFEVNRNFALNCLVSLAIYDVLNELSIPEVKVKWPNDIMSGNQKLCGILIENTLKGQFIKQSVIGFGLNVNQTFFKDLPQATSLQLQTGVDYDLEQLLEQLLKRIQYYLEGSHITNYTTIRNQYEEAMFRQGQIAEYVSQDGTRFKGSIRGITESGQLIIEKINGQILNFNFKEVKYIL